MRGAIVTGATGFLGKYLVSELLKNGIPVCAIVRDVTKGLELKKNENVDIVVCGMDSLANLALCKKIPKQFDTFYHLAWSGSSGLARGDWSLQLKNAEWSVDAVKLASKLGCKKIVGIGTLAEIDVNEYSLLDGSTPNLTSCYGAAKVVSHMMTKAAANTLGVEHSWAIVSNTFGPGNNTENFFNFIANSLLRKKELLLTSGEQLYDLVFVTDVARALFLIGERGKPNNSYFVGAGKPKKLRYFVEKIRDHIDKDIILGFGKLPYNGVYHKTEIFNIKKTREETGYIPQIDFDEGVSVTINWLKEHINREKNGF